MTKKIAVYIDSCAWDVLHAHSVDLGAVFPSATFDLRVTKEVGDFEMPLFPSEKWDLREYVEIQVRKCPVETHSYFGFSSYNDPLDYRPRVGGFDEGSYISQQEAEWFEFFEVAKINERPTGLYKNEADASLAVRACTGGVVLTAEGGTKSGPLKRAALLSGRVVNLSAFDLNTMSLRVRVEKAASNPLPSVPVMPIY